MRPQQDNDSRSSRHGSFEPSDERGAQGGLSELPEGSDEMLARIEEQIHEADGQWHWWWRSRPTWVRRSVLFVLFAAAALVTWLTMRRADWTLYPALRMTVALGSMGIVAAWSLYEAVRPVHRRGPPSWMPFTVAGLALGVTFVLAVLPAAHTATAEAIPESPLYVHASGCLLFGLATGLPIYLLARLLDRGAWGASLLAASAAALTGNFLLQIQCPITAPAHHAAGHFGVAVVWLGAIGGLHRRALGR